MILSADPVFFNKAKATSMAGVQQVKPTASQPMVNNTQESKNVQPKVLLDKGDK